MFTSLSIGLMHQITSFLLEPVIWILIFLLILALYEIGIAFSERYKSIEFLVQNASKDALIQAGKHRIERADFLTRLAPMFGLMGTLIPLGPGLAALGNGQLSILTTAMTVAFDTTIIGLVVGVIGFILGRLRRRWYDNALYKQQGISNG